MQYKITNEQSFQILTSSISIGPSPTGYQLEVSADGKNFSPLFTVGANVTRQVTNLSSGSYYRLKGNEGEVIVNWNRSCVTEGGSGGGSGTTYTAGDFIDITEDVISVTGITPDAYLTSADTKYFLTSADTVDFLTSADTTAFVTSADTVAFVTSGDVKTQVDSAMTDIQLPIAAAINDVRDNFNARLNQQYYTRQEVQDLLKEKASVAETTAVVASYVNENVSPEIAAIYAMIEDKELAISAALNDLNAKKVQSETVKTIWSGTQAEYDALTNSGATANANTQYIII